MSCGDVLSHRYIVIIMASFGYMHRIFLLKSPSEYVTHITNCYYVNKVISPLLADLKYNLNYP